MVSRDELKQLRAEVLRKQRAANAKISRNRAKGVELAGTQFDLRREASRVRSYNIQQLNAYLRDLTSFTSRKTQFVAGAAGKPIPREKWEHYKELESRFNLKVSVRMGKIEDTFIPASGMTIRERDERMVNKKVAQGDLVNRPYTYIERGVHRLTSADALDKLIKDMGNRLKNDFHIKRNKDTEKSFSRMLVVIGNIEAVEKLNALTNNQKDILFNYTNFGGTLAATYGFKGMDGDGKYSHLVDDQMDDINEFLDWASRQPKK